MLCRSPRPFSADVSRYQHGGLVIRRTVFARQRFMPPTYWTDPPFLADAFFIWRTTILEDPDLFLFRYQRCTPDMRTCRCTSDMHTCRYMTRMQILASCTNANHIFLHVLVSCFLHHSSRRTAKMRLSIIVTSIIDNVKVAKRVRDKMSVTSMPMKHPYLRSFFLGVFKCFSF